MTTEDVRELLRQEIAKAESAFAWAVSNNVAPGYISDVLRGKREPGKKVLDLVGVERVISYRKVS